MIDDPPKVPLVAQRPNGNRHYVTEHDVREALCGLTCGIETWALASGIGLMPDVDPRDCAACVAKRPDLAFVPLELPIGFVVASFRTSRRRDMLRDLRMLGPMTYHQRVTRTAVRWLRRKVARTPARLVLASKARVEVDESSADMFVRNQRAIRAHVRVLVPPPGVLEGVAFLEAAPDAGTVVVPVLKSTIA